MNQIGLPKQKLFFGFSFVWTGLLILFLGWSVFSEFQEMHESARIEVRAYYNGVTTFRSWVAGHGGVYAPITRDNPPNPMLDNIDERDIETPSGKKLTLVNPAYMTRQLSNNMLGKISIDVNLTSLIPLNEVNTPDPWERAALEAFEQGESEISEVNQINGQSYMRIIKPLLVESSCLVCHARQGYKIGDIRGGLSISVPMASHQAIARVHTNNMTIALFCIWVIGLFTIRRASTVLLASQKNLEASHKNLVKNEARLSEAQQIAHLGSWEWDINKNALYWSDETYRIFGLPVNSIEPTFESFMKQVHPEDRNVVQENVEASLQSVSTFYEVRHRILLPGGEEKMVYERGKVFFDESSSASRMVGTVLDVSKEWLAEKEQQRANDVEQLLNTLSLLSLQPLDLSLFLSEALKIIIESALIPVKFDKAVIYLINNENKDEFHIEAHYNLSDEEISQYHYISSNEEPGLTLLKHEEVLYIPRVLPSHQIPVDTLLNSGLFFAPLLEHRKNIGVIAFKVEADYSGTEADKTLIRRVANVLSLGISRRIAEQEKQYEAFHDVLTGLPNRRYINDRLSKDIGLATRRKYRSAILFLGLDRFKKINDALGHEIGDSVLKEASVRIKNCLRNEDTVARMGGDEFIVLLSDLPGSEAKVASKASRVSEKIRLSLSSPFIIESKTLHLTVSIGISLYPVLNVNADDLIRNADTSMYKAKQDGRNAICFFDPSMQKEATDRLEMESDLRAALTNNEFSLVYQPQINQSGQIIGAEALIRWKHPKRGFVSPLDFISIAEEVGLIIPIGNWVMKEAMTQAKNIQAMSQPEDELLHMAINISQVQFKHHEFIDHVKQLIDETGVVPESIELEITESMLVENVEETIKKMNILKSIGINFSVDDFGTGYSSLSYLKQLPLDKLKIDQSFVRDVHKSSQDAAIIEAIISMAKHLKMDLIAEGVEVKEELDFLASKGCSKYQGYYFYKPMPGSDYQELVISRLKVD